ncbi:MAG: hypothetical protein F6K65_44115, partial [Moorea sp. SIO3C2]|nr:hypothetical protein [Moorena sp. SIO3C2]
PISRQCDDQALELYRELEQKVEQLVQPPEETLEELNQWLKVIPQRAFNYAKYLRDMKDHRTAITTNIHNYTAKLEQIKALSLPKDDLAFLETFLDRTCKQFQTQIRVDLNYLRPGQDLFEQMTATIRGMIEVKQAESDRNLQQTLQANEAAAQKREQKLELVITTVGTGLAVSGISSQVASDATERILSVSKQDANLPSYVGYSFLDIVFHLLVGVILATPVGIIAWWWRRKPK